MKITGLIWLAGIAAAFYYLAPKAESAPAVATMPDAADNFPPLYPFYLGSGALDPTGAQWPGWQTAPFNPAGWPGGTVEVGDSFGIVAPPAGYPVDPTIMY